MRRLFFLLFLVCSVFLTASETQVTVSTSKMLGTIGDRIKITVRVMTGSDIDKIDVNYGKGDFEAVKRIVKPPVVKDTGKVFEIVDEIVFFKTGDFSVGPGKVSLMKKSEVVEIKETNSLAIKIKTTITDKDKDIRPVKSPLEVEGNPEHLMVYALAVLAGVLIVLLIIYFVRKHRASKERVPVKEIVPPVEELRQRLAELKKKKLIENGKVKEYHLAFTSMMKDFLFRFYGFNAADYTTFETVEALGQCEKDGDLVDSFRYLMDHSDLIKFARMLPEEKQIGVFYKDIDKLMDNLSVEAVRREEREAADVSAG